MANPGQQVVMEGEVTRQAEERYAQLEAQFQEMHQQNEGLN